MKVLDGDERELAEKLEEVLDGIPWLRSRQIVPADRKDQGYDFSMIIPLRDGGSLELMVECKKQPRPSQFPYVARKHRYTEDQERHTQAPVLAAPYISPRMAELCKEHRWGYYDLTGNCYFSFPDVLYIERTGNKPEKKLPRPRANLGTDASARVLRALFSGKYAGKAWTQTELQQACEPSVSIGLVNKVVHYLVDQAWVVMDADGKFAMHDAMALLKEWKRKYRFDRHKRLTYYTLLKPDELENRICSLGQLEKKDSGERVAYAVFSAAERHAPHVKQHKTWLYANKDALDDVVDLLGAKQVDKGENLVIYIPSDDGVFYDCVHDRDSELPRVSAIQTWLDLSHVGSRGDEAAEAIMHQSIEPAWEEGQS